MFVPVPAMFMSFLANLLGFFSPLERLEPTWFSLGIFPFVNNALTFSSHDFKKVIITYHLRVIKMYNTH